MRGSSSSASGNRLIQQQQQQQSLRKRQARELKARLRPGSRATLSVRVALRTRWLRQQKHRVNCELCLHGLQRRCEASRRRASQPPPQPGWEQSSCMYCCQHPGKPKANRRGSEALTSRRGPSSGRGRRCQGEARARRRGGQFGWHRRETRFAGTAVQGGITLNTNQNLASMPTSRLAGPQHNMTTLIGIVCRQAHLHAVKEASRAARGHHSSGAGQLEDISIGDLGAGRQLQSKAWRQGQFMKGWRSEGQGHARAGAALCWMSSCSCARCAHEVGNPL